MLAIRPRVDIYSETPVDMDDSTDEDEPIFLDRPAAKTLRSISAVSLHQRSIGYTDDQRADITKTQALQELRQRKSLIAKRRARSFRGKDSRSIARQKHDSSNSLSTAAHTQQIPGDPEVSATSKVEAKEEGTTFSGLMEEETHDHVDDRPATLEEDRAAFRSVEAALAQHVDESDPGYVEVTTRDHAMKLASLGSDDDELEEPTQDQAQPSNAEATRLDHEQAIAEEAQKQLRADPTFGELAGLLGGLTDSDSDTSSEGAEIEDHGEEASSAHVAALSNLQPTLKDTEADSVQVQSRKR